MTTAVKLGCDQRSMVATAKRPKASCHQTYGLDGTRHQTTGCGTRPFGVPGAAVAVTRRTTGREIAGALGGRPSIQDKPICFLAIETRLCRGAVCCLVVSVESDRDGDSVGIMVASSFGGRGCLGRGSGGRYQMGPLGSWRRVTVSREGKRSRQAGEGPRRRWRPRAWSEVTSGWAEGQPVALRRNVRTAPERRQAYGRWPTAQGPAFSLTADGSLGRGRERRRRGKRSASCRRYRQAVGARSATPLN